MTERIWSSALAVFLIAAAGQAQASPCLNLPDKKVGAQLYSFADEFLDKIGEKARPQALSSSLAEMRAAGFTQFEGFLGTLGLPSRQYQAIVQRSEEREVGNHSSLEAADWKAAMETAEALGQHYIGSAEFGAPGLDSLADTLATAKQLNRLGKDAANHGLRLYVHNHWLEFTTKFPYDLRHDGKVADVPAWEIVAANTDPRYVSFEVDIHWARKGLGIDRNAELLSFLRRYRNRIVTLHMKDTAPDGSITDLGRGTTDWPAIVKAAGPQIAYYIWEYDRPPHPAQSASIGYHFLTCRSP